MKTEDPKNRENRNLTKTIGSSVENRSKRKTLKRNLTKTTRSSIGNGSPSLVNDATGFFYSNIDLGKMTKAQVRTYFQITRNLCV